MYLDFAQRCTQKLQCCTLSIILHIYIYIIDLIRDVLQCCTQCLQRCTRLCLGAKSSGTFTETYRMDVSRGTVTSKPATAGDSTMGQPTKTVSQGQQARVFEAIKTFLRSGQPARRGDLSPPRRKGSRRRLQQREIG